MPNSEGISIKDPGENGRGGIEHIVQTTMENGETLFVGHLPLLWPSSLTSFFLFAPLKSNLCFIAQMKSALFFFFLPNPTLDSLCLTKSLRSQQHSLLTPNNDLCPLDVLAISSTNWSAIQGSISLFFFYCDSINTKPWSDKENKWAFAAKISP